MQFARSKTQGEKSGQSALPIVRNGQNGESRQQPSMSDKRSIQFSQAAVLGFGPRTSRASLPRNRQRGSKQDNSALAFESNLVAAMEEEGGLLSPALSHGRRRDQSRVLLNRRSIADLPKSRLLPKPLRIGVGAIIPADWENGLVTKSGQYVAEQENSKKQRSEKAYGQWIARKRAEEALAGRYSSPLFDCEKQALAGGRRSTLAGHDPLLKMSLDALPTMTAFPSASPLQRSSRSSIDTQSEVRKARKTREQWLAEKVQIEQAALDNLWVKAEEEIEQEDSIEGARLSRKQQARFDRHSLQVQKRLLIKTRVLDMSSQQHGAVQRPLSGIPRQFMIPEHTTRFATEEAQYELGIKIIGLLDNLDQIAPGSLKKSDERIRCRSFGLPPKLPPEPQLETIDYYM
jgi:hypothetical protein